MILTSLLKWFNILRKRLHNVFRPAQAIAEINDGLVILALGVCLRCFLSSSAFGCKFRNRFRDSSKRELHDYDESCVTDQVLRFSLEDLEAAVRVR